MMRSGIVFSVEEGDALRFLDALCGRERSRLPRRPFKEKQVRPELARVVHDRMARLALRFLVEGGGYRERTVLREGRRISGRIWDAALNEGFSLRFGEASFWFWLSSARELPQLVEQPKSFGRHHRKILRELVPERALAPGDWIFFTLAYQNLSKFGLSFEIQEALARRMRAMCPLLPLLALERDEGRPGLEGEFLLLCQPGAVRVLESIDDVLFAAWKERVNALELMPMEAERFTQQWDAIATVLQTYLNVLDRVRRMDLARVVMRFVRFLVTEAFAKGGDALRAQIASMSGVKTLAQRDRVIQTIARAVDLGPWLLRRRDELGMERYGDERYEEAQIFLRQTEETLDPIREQIESLSRGLSGIIG